MVDVLPCWKMDTAESRNTVLTSFFVLQLVSFPNASESDCMIEAPGGKIVFDSV